MPIDNPNTDGDPPVTTEAPGDDLAEVINRLIPALRSPLPEGFEWDFRRFATCACGLCNRLGLDGEAIDVLILDIAGSLRANPFSAHEWEGVVPLYSCPARDVTPATVADKLEALIARTS